MKTSSIELKRIEDEVDIELFDCAYLEFFKNPKTYTIDEVIKELDIIDL